MFSLSYFDRTSSDFNRLNPTLAHFQFHEYLAGSSEKEALFKTFAEESGAGAGRLIQDPDQQIALFLDLHVSFYSANIQALL